MEKYQKKNQAMVGKDMKRLDINQGIKVRAKQEFEIKTAHLTSFTFKDSLFLREITKLNLARN